MKDPLGICDLLSQVVTVSGFLTKVECDSWPVEKCSVEKVKVKKTTPDTSCSEQSRQLCAPKGCAEKQVEYPLTCKILKNILFYVHFSVTAVRTR